jgi:predicted dienelactone hydrolase
MKKKIIFVIVALCFICLGIFLIIRYHNKEYIEGEMYIENSSNQKLYAVLHRPNVRGKMPIVIYSHGLGATYRAGSDYAKELASYGIMTLCFDFRGGSNRSKSDGKTTEMSIVTEYDDLETILDEVKTWDFVDKDRIVL